MSQIQNKKPTQEEIDYIESLQNETKKWSKFVSIQPGETASLHFKFKITGPEELRSPRIEQKEFKGELSNRIVFDVYDLKDDVEKVYSTSAKWANMIMEYLKKGHVLLEIKRTGTGPTTNYIITPIIS